MGDESMVIAPLFIGYLCAAIAGLLVGLTLASIILRFACSMVGIRVPGFGWAMLTVVVVGVATGIANTMIGACLFGIAQGVIVSGSRSRPDPGLLFAVYALFLCIVLPFDAMISAGLYVPLLETTFGKGLLVWFMQRVIGLAIALMVGCLFGLLMLLTSGIR